MVQLERRTSEIHGEGIFSIACSASVMFCLVVTVLGIKLKWFKHRLNFEQTPASTSKRESLTKVDGLQGVFRKRDEDSQIDIDRPKSLPPVRIRKHSPHHQSFHISLPPTKKGNGLPSTIPKPPPMPAANNGQQQYPQPTTSKVPSKHKRNKRTAEIQNSGDKKDVTVNSFHNEKTSTKTDKSKHYEKLKSSEKNLATAKMPPRRPTGYVRPQMDELNAEEENYNSNEKSSRKHQEHEFKKVKEKSKIILKLENTDSNLEEPTVDKVENSNTHEEFIPKPEPRTTTKSDKEEQKSIIRNQEEDDSWSAVQRHRELTQQLTARQRAISLEGGKNNKEQNGEYAKDGTSSEHHKPKTMRDMKKHQDHPSSKNATVNLENSTDEIDV